MTSTRGARYTLADYIRDLTIQMDDEGHVRWPLAQKEAAIRAAVRAARGRWWTERIYSHHEYNSNVFRYTLPPGCEEVEDVWFEPLVETRPRYFISPVRWRQEGEELVFTGRFGRYEGQTLHIRYLAYAQNITSIRQMNGILNAGNLTLEVVAPGPFITEGVTRGDEILIHQIILGEYPTFYVDEVQSAVTITMDRPSPVTQVGVAFSIAWFSDLPHEYVMNRAMAELFEMASRNRPGRENEENIRWATYYRQLADNAIRLQRRTARPARRF